MGATEHKLTQDPAAQDKRSAAKRAQILEGARRVFMERGFDGASIDEIARVAGVSKPTLYRHYPDKQHLYSAFFTRECDRFATTLFPHGLEDLSAAEALDRVARAYLDRLLSGSAQSAFHVAVGDAQQFPELALAFYETGPARGVRHVERLLHALIARAEVQIDDVPLAAAQFLELCKADQFYKRVFGVITAADPAEVDRVVRGAIDVFLRAYAPRSAGCPPTQST